MTDRETADAIDSLASRVKARDAAIRNSEDDIPDAEVFAGDYVTAMRGHGWRPTEAKIYPTWKPSGTAGLPSRPETVDQVAMLRADLAAKAAAARKAKDAAAQAGPQDAA